MLVDFLDGIALVTMANLPLIHNAKLILRREIKQKLKLLTEQERNRQSDEVTRKLLSHPCYKSARSVAVFISMPDEIDTSLIIEDLFSQGKLCYIPRYNEDGTNYMTMVLIHSLEDFSQLWKTKWNIPQPITFQERDDCLVTGNLDLVLVPGLGFTRGGHRLGRGKGFYDRFLRTYEEKFGKVYTIGIALKECIVQEIPLSENDVLINEVLSA